MRDAQRPLIGVTCGVMGGTTAPKAGVGLRYTEAIEAAGGLPVLIPPVNRLTLEHLLPHLHGIVLTGGGDVDPRAYGEEPVPQVTNVEPARDETELALAREALRRRIPVLGVCRGLQVINVAAGGTLIQHLTPQRRTDVRHNQTAPRSQPTHRVTLWAGSKLARICEAEQLWVNSFHHQAVKDVAPGLRASAWAPDGVVEAIESDDNDGFVVGVQWHPEELWATHTPSFALFQHLVSEARNASQASRGGSFSFRRR